MFLLQNVYTSKESTSYIVSSKLLQTLEAAIKERDDAVEDAVVNHYGDITKIPLTSKKALTPNASVGRILWMSGSSRI